MNIIPFVRRKTREQEADELWELTIRYEPLEDMTVRELGLLLPLMIASGSTPATGAEKTWCSARHWEALGPAQRHFVVLQDRR